MVKSATEKGQAADASLEAAAQRLKDAAAKVLAGKTPEQQAARVAEIRRVINTACVAKVGMTLKAWVVANRRHRQRREARFLCRRPERRGPRRRQQHSSRLAHRANAPPADAEGDSESDPDALRGDDQDLGQRAERDGGHRVDAPRRRGDLLPADEYLKRVLRRLLAVTT